MSNKQPQESQDQELRVKAVWNHGIAPLYDGVRGHFTRFLGRWNYPQRGGTRPRGRVFPRGRGEVARPGVAVPLEEVS